MMNVFRLLQISSFNGKMNALNEVNKLIANVSYNLHKHGQGELDEWLTAEKVAVSRSTVLSWHACDIQFYCEILILFLCKCMQHCMHM